MGQTARFQETLRRLAMIDEGFVADEAGLRLGQAGASALDPKTTALLQLGVSAAIGSQAVCLEWSTGRALAAGATEDEIADVLLAIAPVAGLGRVVCAAPGVATALVGLASEFTEPLVGGPLADAVQGPPDGLRAGGRGSRHDHRIQRFQASRSQPGQLGPLAVLPFLDVRRPLPDEIAHPAPVAIAGDGVVAERVLDQPDLREFFCQVARELIDRRVVGQPECY